MKKIYVLSGIGADASAFGKVTFGGYSPLFIQWIPPQRKESIAMYSARLLPQIKEENPILLGLSFGGIMAIEIAQKIPVQKIIQISSITSSQHISSFMKTIGKMGLHKIAPFKMVNSPNPVTSKIFGVHTKEEKAILYHILQNSDKDFTKWALGEIPKWKNPPIEHCPVISIHGEKDQIFPLGNRKCDYVLSGGHSLPLTHTKELSDILSQVLE